MAVTGRALRQSGGPAVIGDGEPSRPEQNVTADSGYAYGCIGADIHVLGSGLPLYLLANWQAEPEADREWLRELPSRMLNARRAVVGFTGRGEELADLRSWRDSGPRLAVRWLHGPGGQGKTRLAGQFAAESLKAGWKVVAAFHGPDADRPEPGSQDMRLDGAAGLLVIVDYADRWRLGYLSWLLENALLHQAGAVTRVLMLARTADAWPAVRGILDTHQAGISSHQLAALSSAEARAAMFTAARDSFAAIYQMSPTSSATLADVPDSPGFELTLAVHMAALVAVDACAVGRRPPRDMAGLTVYLLDRERLHWARLYGDGTGQAWAHSYRTPPEVMNRAVYTAALTGPVTPAAGAAALHRLRLPGPETILHDHAACYPPAGPGHATVLEPLYPDRLAEDFLALTMPGHPADYPALAWAGPATAALLARDDQDSPPPGLSRSVVFLAAAADRWDHVGREHLYPLLRRDPQLAVDAGGSALIALARSSPADLLEAIDQCLPLEGQLDLDLAGAVLAERLAPHRLAATDVPEEQLMIHTDVAVRANRAGLHDRALDAIDKALAVLSGLWPEEDQPEDDPVLAEELALKRAGLLTMRGSFLFQLGRREEALRVTREAVAIARDTPSPSPASRKLAVMGGMQLSGALSENGLLEEALAAGRSAAEQARSLPEADHDREKILAGVLAFLLVHLGKAESWDESLTVGEEVLAAERRLADPGRGHYLAEVLSNFSAALARTGQGVRAVSIAAEAVDSFRRLAEINPRRFERNLADSLTMLGIRQSELRRYQAAIDAQAEAVAILRSLARANPAAYLPGLARSLSNLGGDQAAAGQYQPALASEQEALRIRRELALGNPAAFELDVARSLHRLAIRLSERGRPEDAARATFEAITILRRPAMVSSRAGEYQLSLSLANLGVWLSRLERWHEAAEATAEGVAIRRQLAGANLAVTEPDLARSLTALGSQLSRLGRFPEALEAAVEAVGLYERWPATHPSPAFRSQHAGALTELGMRLSETGHHEEALARTSEAMAMYRQLAEEDVVDRHDYASALKDFAQVRLSADAELPEAARAIEESVTRYRQLAERNPEAPADDLRDALRVSADALARLSPADPLPGRHRRR